MLLALAFGAVGVPAAAVLTTTVTLVGLARQEEGLDSLMRNQILLMVILPAMYAIAAAIESESRTTRELVRTSQNLEVANERLALLARTDELTGLLNRRGLSQTLEFLWAWCVRESKPVAILMVDIDFFHHYNEAYGHSSGDAVLIRIASIMRWSARRKTDLAVRYGGEEFLIVLPDARHDHAQRVADLIHEQVRDLNIEHSGSPVAPILTVSIGMLALAKATAAAETNSIDCCDALLFEAKGKGRNRTVAAQQ
ncbi:MAG: GGDEF domain-containing protein [Mycolicibacterium sp.]|uniref:GGDEF domain-containing protein n=1 Tax=Mycolicibacterium sp. TaxID=2320850 RepID=UPI003D151FE0